MRKGARPVWVDRNQIPAIFGISDRTVALAINAGAPIERRFVGTKPVFNVDSIDAWLDGLPLDKPEPK